MFRLALLAFATACCLAPRAAAQPPLPPGPAPDAPLAAPDDAAVRAVGADVPLPPLEAMRVEPVGGGATLELERVIGSVREHYPSLIAERERVRAARADQQVAQGGFDLGLTAQVRAVGGYYDYVAADTELRQPTPLWGLTVFGGWRIGRGFDPAGLAGDDGGYLGQGSIPGYYGELETLSGGELRVGARLPLWRNGPIDSLRAATRRADLGLEAARAQLTVRRLALERAAATTYWKWVAAGAKYRIAAELLALAEVREAQIARRVERGALPAIERLENRRAVLSRRQSLVDARRELEAAAIDLSLYVRRDDGRPRLPSTRELPADVPFVEFEAAPAAREAVREALRRRPETARLEALVARGEVALELAENQAAPQIDVTVQASQDLGDGRSEQDKRLGDLVLSGSLLFSTPLQRRALTGAADRAAAELGAVRAEAELAQQQVIADVLDARSALDAARDRLEVAEPNAEIAALVAAAELRRFELGAADLFTVNLREQIAAEAAARRAEARGLLHAAIAGWRTALGLSALGEP